MSTLIVVDVEATCWPDNHNHRMEIIEIGAVALSGEELATVREFQSFVRPIQNPTLSSFCSGLTTITQEEVDSADKFPDVLGRFIKWIGTDDCIIGAWGNYDHNQFMNDCKLHGISIPDCFDNYVNLKSLYSIVTNSRPCGMGKALNKCGLQLYGTHHRGIDDARNIAGIVRFALKDKMTKRLKSETFTRGQ